MQRLRSSLLVLLATLAAALGSSSSVAARSLPSGKHSEQSSRAGTAPVAQGFVGVDVDGPLYGSGTPIDLGGQLGRMVANGVQSVRVAFSWQAAQPYQSWSEVPSFQHAQFTNEAGVPTDFQLTDMLVGEAARRHVTVLPTVMYAANWDAKPNPRGNFATPRRVAPYAAYLAALIARYGPRGSFWKQNPGTPKLAIRRWQIWNEPNSRYDWPQPFAASYVSLLRGAHDAIKRADPGAQVVLGALTNSSWRAWAQINKIKGSSRLYDIVSQNDFTKEPANVILAMQLMRTAMSTGGVHKPLLATEWSWPSALGKTSQHYDWDTTEAGQARNIATLLPMLGRERQRLGLIGFDYYTWMSEEAKGSPAFAYAGLLRLRNGIVTTKPALAAFRRGALALEQCARKGSLATTCIK